MVALVGVANRGCHTNGVAAETVAVATAIVVASNTSNRNASSDSSRNSRNGNSATIVTVAEE